jgi:hypothetical protein
LNARENKFRVLKQEYQTVCRLAQDGKWPPHVPSKTTRPKSAMIDKEMVDLEKIKRKQQLDIEKMLGQEMNRKSIEMRNAEKA